MMPVTARRTPVTAHTDGANVVLKVSYVLDPPAGRLLVDAVAAAVANAPRRIEIDLRSLASWTPEGARALVECREICGDLPDGLHYRTGRGPGREALLAAYA